MSIDWGFALAELLVVLVLLGPAIVRGIGARRRRRRRVEREPRGTCALCLTRGQVLHVRDKRYGPLCISCVDAVHRMRSGLRVQGK